uniref:Ubiquitin-like domain-containing protein n=1 Tax=Alexandrium andersonii TaxID=327968 RepID=A0A7S2ISU4_9DINO|mmetsp:Transcript_87728/g.196080  ORF Transcript_87728/g.196080 Transcript_87728/m.196080 type:complete len:316 (+) Transcript_87728:64-1011(+)
MGEAPDDLPRPPPSPFVARLRTEVESAREWEQKPSVASWLATPSPRRPPAESVTRGVRFASEPEVCLGQVRPPAPVISLRFKGSAAKPFKIDEVSADITVRDLKMLCESTCGLEPDMQRMLFKGRILQDQQTLQEASLPSGAAIFLVRGSSGSGAPVSPSVREEREREIEQERALHRREMEAAALLAGPPCLDCGVNPGRLQTDGLCSICFREQVVKENRLLKKRREEARKREREAAEREVQRQREEEERERISRQDASRCYFCNKKIGLTGFQCQCGYFFCAAHRYAEDHDCSFDHKAHGREILAKQSAQGLKD